MKGVVYVEVERGMRGLLGPCGSHWFGCSQRRMGNRRVEGGVRDGRAGVWRDAERAGLTVIALRARSPSRKQERVGAAEMCTRDPRLALAGVHVCSG